MSTPERPGGETADEPDVSIDVPLNVRNVSLSVLAALAGVLMLQYAQTVLIPIVLAVLISYAMGPAVAPLERRLPRAIAAALVLIALIGAGAIATYELTDQVLQIAEQVPDAAERVRARMRETRRDRGGALETVQRAATEVEKTATAASKPPPAPTGVQKVQIVQPAFSAGQYLRLGGIGLIGAVGQLTLILFLVYFLLVSGDLYKRKLVKIAGPTLTDKKITVQILEEIDDQMERFIGVQVLTSALVGAATTAALWWFGLNQWIVWGLLAGIFNSIPYLGPVIVTGGVGVVAFLQFDDALKTLTVCAVALAITSLEGFLLTPALMGRAARMNPVAIFVGLLFWSWIWGVWGTILAVPMLMMLKAICDRVEDLQPIGELLGE
ncbi:MAG TPA: AI-2E family transporter [Gemmatimonadaceae bacterium]